MAKGQSSRQVVGLAIALLTEPIGVTEQSGEGKKQGGAEKKRMVWSREGRN